MKVNVRRGGKYPMLIGGETSNVDRRRNPMLIGGEISNVNRRRKPMFQLIVTLLDPA